MKILIVGLGNFGASLGEKLTLLGNEVIGIDSDMAKVERNKEKISYTICMDSTDPTLVATLPIKETDVSIIAIGEHEGANIMSTAVLKNLNAKRIIARAINPLQETILEAMGVEEVVHPEEETAERWAKKLNMRGILDSFTLSRNHSIVEVKVPRNYIGRTVGDIGLRANHNLVILTTIKYKEEKNLIGQKRKIMEAQGVSTYDTILGEGDIMVIYGDNNDIKDFMKRKEISDNS